LFDELEIWSVGTFPLEDIPAELAASIEDKRRVVTIEEHYRSGGLGEALSYALLTSGVVPRSFVCPVPAVEQEMIAHVHGRRVRSDQGRQQRFAFRRSRVVDFVVAVERPDSLERRAGCGRVDRHVHACGCLCARRAGQREQREQEWPRSTR
jgi:hypothetical protein